MLHIFYIYMVFRWCLFLKFHYLKDLRFIEHLKAFYASNIDSPSPFNTDCIGYLIYKIGVSWNCLCWISWCLLKWWTENPNCFQGTNRPTNNKRGRRVKSMNNRHHHDRHKGGPRHLCMKILNTGSEEIREWEYLVKFKYTFKEHLLKRPYTILREISKILAQKHVHHGASVLSMVLGKEKFFCQIRLQRPTSFCWESKPGI